MAQAPYAFEDDGASVRVFISSTFLDMQAERDELVRKAFPALRAKFRARGVELTNVDLRWGVRPEDVEAGQALPICLAEVDRCRPYFIGLLGERYGWRLSKEPSADLIAAYPVLRDAIGRSMTEIEVMHGVLLDPKAVPYALFFERSSKWIESVPPDERAPYLSEDDAARTMIADLKARVRACGARIISYERPADIAATVQQVLGALLETRFAGSQRPDAFTLTNRLHAAYARERRDLYIGGEQYLAVIDRWVDQTSQNTPLLAVGASGSGKSALVANWIAGHRSRAPKDVVFEHYLGASPDSADPVLIIRRLWEHLNRVTAEVEAPPLDERALFDGFPQRIANAAAYTDRRGGRIVIALDGLDKLTRGTDLHWLPEVWPSRVYVLASSLDGSALNAAEARRWSELAVRPLTSEEQRQLVALILDRMGKRLSRVRLERILAHPLSGLPLFLKTLLDELRVSSDESGLDARLANCLGSESVRDLFMRILRRLEGDCGAPFTAEACALIWAGRIGLEERCISEITGTPPLSWSILRNGLGDALRDQAGRVTFSHDFLRQAVNALYIPDESTEQQIRLKLADYFESQPRDARQAEELPYQLRESRAFDRLERLLTDLDRFSVLAERGHVELLSHWIALTENGRSLDLLRTAFFERHGAAPPYDRRVMGEARVLSEFLLFAGAYGGALALEEWLLKVRTDALGPYHADVLASLNNIAFCYYETGDSARALEIEERLVQDARRAFGDDDPRTIVSTENLAMSLTSRGQYARALELLERVARARAKSQGAHDEDTLRTQGYIGSALADLGRYQEAQELLSGVLKRVTKAFGDEHVQTLRTKAALAGVIEQLGRYRDALPLRREVFATREHLFGPRHKMTLASMGALGRTLFQAGESAEARTLMEQLLMLQEQALGPDHPQMQTTLINYAAMLFDSGDFRAARALEERALESSVRRLGADHPDALSAMASLGATLKKLGEHRAALSFKQRATDGLTRTMGPDHPRTLAAKGGLALTLFDLEKHEEARSLLTEVVEALRKHLGPEHPDTLIGEENLAMMTNELGDRKGALSLQQHVAEVRSHVLGPDHPYSRDAAKVLQGFQAGPARGITVKQLKRVLARIGYDAVEHPATTSIARPEADGRVALLCSKQENSAISFNCMLLTPDGGGGLLSGVFGIAMPSSWHASAEQVNQLNSTAQAVRFGKLTRHSDGMLALEWDFVAANLSDAALSEIINIWLAWSAHIIRQIRQMLAGSPASS